MVARILPNKQELEKLVNMGLTHQQIADRVSEDIGMEVARSTVSAALHRAGLTKAQTRHDDVLPWRVYSIHLKAYPARMLRLLGRKRKGQTLSVEEEQRLSSWLRSMAADNSVVGYDPSTPEGFWYVDRLPGDPEDIPIRLNTIKLSRGPANVSGRDIMGEPIYTDRAWGVRG